MSVGVLINGPRAGESLLLDTTMLRPGGRIFFAVESPMSLRPVVEHPDIVESAPRSTFVDVYQYVGMSRVVPKTAFFEYVERQ